MEIWELVSIEKLMTESQQLIGYGRRKKAKLRINRVFVQPEEQREKRKRSGSPQTSTRHQQTHQDACNGSTRKEEREERKKHLKK